MESLTTSLPPSDQDLHPRPKIDTTITNCNLADHDVSPLSGPSPAISGNPISESITSHRSSLEASDGVAEQQHRDSIKEEPALGSSAHSELLSSFESTALQSDLNGVKERDMFVQSQEMKGSKARRPRVLRLWWLEISACVTSFACFGAILGVLAHEDGKPLSQWNFHINANTEIGPTAVVSFISTLGKSSLLLVTTEAISQLKWLHFAQSAHSLLDLEVFDSASRGPLGSLWLLWTQRWHHWVASWAALCVVLSLIVDPFIQLVFKFPMENRPSDLEEARFRTAKIYNPSHYIANSSTSLTDVGNVDLSMQSAVLRGFFDSPVQIAATCSSGDCTFSNMTTLGVCSTCSQITNGIQTTCSRATDDISTENETIIESCDYTMPTDEYREGGVTIEAHIYRDVVGTWSSTRWNSSTYRSIIHISDGESMMPRPAFLVQMYAIQLPELNSVGEELSVETAWKCSFIACEKTFESINVTQGVLSASTPTHQPLQIQKYTFEDSSNRSGENMIFLGPGNSTAAPYQINEVDGSNLENYLRSLFTVGWWNNATFESTRQPDFQSRSAFTIHNAQTPDIGRALAETKDIPALFRMVADNMTENMRVGGVQDLADTVRLENGTAFRTEAYIHVRWAYLVLPFTLTASSTAILVVAIIMTERSNVPTWKSCSLAMLFHSLAGWESKDRVPIRASELEVLAKSLKGRLSRDEWPPAFVKQD